MDLLLCEDRVRIVCVSVIDTYVDEYRVVDLPALKKESYGRPESSSSSDLSVIEGFRSALRTEPVTKPNNAIHLTSSSNAIVPGRELAEHELPADRPRDQDVRLMVSRCGRFVKTHRLIGLAS